MTSIPSSFWSWLSFVTDLTVKAFDMKNDIQPDLLFATEDSTGLGDSSEGAGAPCVDISCCGCVDVSDAFVDSEESACTFSDRARASSLTISDSVLAPTGSSGVDS